MLVVRKEQLEFLRLAHRSDFRSDLLAHIRKFFPEMVAGKMERELLAHIDEALDHAARYRIEAERDLYKFINITMLYGPDFDDKEEFAWAVEYLLDEDIPDAGQRVHRLYQDFLYRLDPEHG